MSESPQAEVLSLQEENGELKLELAQLRKLIAAADGLIRSVVPNHMGDLVLPHEAYTRYTNIRRLIP